MPDVIIPPFVRSPFTHSPLIYGGGIRKVAGGAAALTTLTFRSSATSTIATITGPADIVAGDVLVLLDRAHNGVGIPTQVVPSGFTVINTIDNGGNGDYARQVLSYKIATGSEASASLTGMDGDDLDFKILAVFQGDVPVTSVAVQDVNGQMTDGDPTAQVKDASGGNSPLIVLGGYVNTAAAVSPRTWTGGTPSSLNNTTSMYLLHEVMNSSPGDRTIDMDDEGFDNGLQSCYLECA